MENQIISKKKGAYDLVFKPNEFMKRKRKNRTVILHKSLLPLNCKMCNKKITKEEGNRTLLAKKGKELIIIPMHYECSWDFTFASIDRIGHELNARKQLKKVK